MTTDTITDTVTSDLDDQITGRIAAARQLHALMQREES